jgi:hypothetical protein
LAKKMVQGQQVAAACAGQGGQECGQAIIKAYDVSPQADEPLVQTQVVYLMAHDLMSLKLNEF